MVEALVTLFVVVFAAIVLYGHVLVAQALLGRKDGAETPAREREAEPRAQAQLRQVG
jgi:hypothetical protein